MVLLKRINRIYRFYLLNLVFCLFLGKLVYFKNDLFKIVYFLPDLNILFYPIYAAMITYMDYMFVTDYLYYYISYRNEVSIRITNNKCVLKKVFICWLLLILKLGFVNKWLFGNYCWLFIFVYAIIEILYYCLMNKMFKRFSLDKRLMIIVIIALVVRQVIGSCMF